VTSELKRLVKIQQAWEHTQGEDGKEREEKREGKREEGKN
jgi:hypothetical protein